MKYYSVAIDGPAGAGKSTIARCAAEKLGFVYVDTGAIYRTVACAAARNDLKGEDVSAIEALLPSIKVKLTWTEDGLQHMFLNGEDVTGQIREPRISQLTSQLSAIPAVREFLMETQRDTAKTHNVIMDGRDIGTVVLPYADIKIFLFASAEERAKRRYLELQRVGKNTSFEEVYKEMVERDERDSNRTVAPLKPAKDAIMLDTSKLNLQESIDAVIATIQRKIEV